VGRRPIELSYIGYAVTFRECIKDGDLKENLPAWLWRVWSARNHKYTWASREQDPLWHVAKAQAERFIEENRALIAEEELSS
jgi:hypothetical protein